jgi:hypothetical protein
VLTGNVFKHRQLWRLVSFLSLWNRGFAKGALKSLSLAVFDPGRGCRNRRFETPSFLDLVRK